MRIAAWNCLQKFSSNLPFLLALDPDLAVVSESQPLQDWPTGTDGRLLSHSIRTPYPGSPKHLTVFAAEPWTVLAHRQADTAPPWLLPVLVAGPTPILLLGLWPVDCPGWPSYVAQVSKALDWLDVHRTDLPVVMAGDFNAPIASTRVQWERLLPRFAIHGLVDAFQAVQPGGEECAPTFFQNWRRDRPFHIDHVFIPAAWARCASVQVGDYDTWVAGGRSDHVPVTVDLRLDLTPGDSACNRT